MLWFNRKCTSVSWKWFEVVIQTNAKKCLICENVKQSKKNVLKSD